MESLRLKENLLKRQNFIYSLTLALGISLVACQDNQDSKITKEPEISKAGKPTADSQIESLETDTPQHPTPTKEQTIWCQTCYPTEISIPKISLIEQVQDSSYIKKESAITYNVPESGVARSPDPVSNNIIIFGHSKKDGKIQPIGRIVELEVDDQIQVVNQVGQKQMFQVTQMALVSANQPGSTLGEQEELTLTLITTAKTEKGWVLDKQKVESKTGQEIAKNDNNYLDLIVIASPID